MSILFIVVEVVGAILGYGTLKYLTPVEYLGSSPGLCMTMPHPLVTSTQAFFIEFFLTFTLVMAVSAVWDPRNGHNSDSTSVRIGEN